MSRCSCEDIAEFISAYVDKELTSQDRQVVEAHLRECPECAARLQSYQRLQTGLQDYLASIPVPPLHHTGPATAGQKGTVIAMDPTKPKKRSLMKRLAFTAAAAAAVAVIALAITSLTNPAGTVQAQEILNKAAQVAGSPNALGIRSVEMTRTSWIKLQDDRFGPVGSLIETDLHLWWEEPNRWRMETSQTKPDEYSNTTVTDGKTMWVASGDGKEVTIGDYDPEVNVLRAFSALSGVKNPSGTILDSAGLSALLENAEECYEPKILGEETVAGRTAYVIDLGESKCPSASVQGMNGRRVIWVDKETFFELRSEQYAEGSNTEVIASDEVTSIRYGADLDDALFTYVPANDAAVEDMRPKPIVDNDDLGAFLEDVADKVRFPLFVPAVVPDGLAPRQPNVDASMIVSVTYVPAGSSGEPAGQESIQLTQQLATYNIVARWTEGAESVDVPEGKGWLRRGVRNVDGTGTDSAALILRDGTLVSLSSFTVSPESLLEMAKSLQPVPGSKAPLPEIVPPALSEVRENVSFPVFVPTYVPDGLTPEPPLGGENENEPVDVNYHAADGAKALRVTSGPAGSRPEPNAEQVTLSSGMTAQYVAPQPPLEESSVWWEQEGAFIDVSSSVLSKDELLKVAGSVSATAGIGNPEVVDARPAPTVVPAPAFTILRPSWLPEEMTVTEQYEPGMPDSGSSLVFGFDPRPNDAQPHEVLTLREIPFDQSDFGAISDPQEIKETIGGHEVTIVMRGGKWITLTWVQGDLVLTLTNPYDPPGEPKYSHEDLRKIVESVR